MNALLGTYTPCQIAMIVKDVEESKKAIARFLGQEVPPMVGSGDDSVAKTVYMGERSPDTDCKMAFFDLGNIQLELIEPGPGKSTWRDHLEQHGEGLHHFGYQVPDIFKAMEDMKNAGYECTQWGYYGDGSGAYAYFDCTRDLKYFVELLCSF